MIEDDDYMSSKFVVEESSEDKRKPEEFCNNVTQKKRKVLEKESRETALSNSIPESNVGFQLLKSMGYSPGIPLKEGALLEPIIPTERLNRSGLGNTTSEETEVKEESEIINVIQLEGEFKSRKLEEFQLKLVKKDLRNAKAACEDLDSLKYFPRSPFWLSSVTEDSDEKISEEQATLLNEIIDYLRKTHFYCLYCGCCFENAEDLKLNCPGEFRKDHDE